MRARGSKALTLREQDLRWIPLLRRRPASSSVLLSEQQLVHVRSALSDGRTRRVSESFVEEEAAEGVATGLFNLGSSTMRRAILASRAERPGGANASSTEDANGHGSSRSLGSMATMAFGQTQRIVSQFRRKSIPVVEPYSRSKAWRMSKFTAWKSSFALVKDETHAVKYAAQAPRSAVVRHTTRNTQHCAKDTYITHNAQCTQCTTTQHTLNT